ncbi:uncharacterized protein LOC106160995 [Lingula anatina]|uniref:Uncharacterized protein LOC106160995 n=1 Tax=Lingula anatina TaxID=7574 RepID=A0A1S3I4S5_LINAN|nr:uncharacterized protein LOC106160995 [Lingula anatina]|eukprot:XP_013393270.1 uncharacterized protein LOC106160995 [Lingula anatina]
MSTPIDQETLKHNAGAVQQNACKKVKTGCRNELDSTPNLGVKSKEENRRIKSDSKASVEKSREMNINPQKDKTSIQNVSTDAHQGQPERSQSISLPPGPSVSGQPKGGDLDQEEELVRRPESAPPLLEQTPQAQDSADEGEHENPASCQKTHQQKDDRYAHLEEKFVELQNQFVKETEEKEALKIRLEAAIEAVRLENENLKERLGELESKSCTLEYFQTKCEQLESKIHKCVCCKTATLGGAQGLTMSDAAQITEDTPGAGTEQTTPSTSAETTASPPYPTTGVKRERSTKRTVPFFQRAPRSPVFGADQNFLNEVISGLKDCGITLEQENLENVKLISSAPLILFCLQSSRLGTDVDQALREYKGARLDIILIVMRHLPRHARRFTPTQQVLPRHPQVKLTVDIVFWETEGFYQCEENQEAIVQVISYFQYLCSESV